MWTLINTVSYQASLTLHQYGTELYKNVFIRDRAIGYFHSIDSILQFSDHLLTRMSYNEISGDIYFCDL